MECAYSRSFDSQVDALFRIIAFYVKVGEKILGAAIRPRGVLLIENLC
jgi:hypothetical protein